MLEVMDYPLGKSAPRQHPGKEFVKYLIASRSCVFQEAAMKSATKYPDRTVPSKQDIITDVLTTLDQEGGKFKQMTEYGVWYSVGAQVARKRVSQLFADYKRQQKKHESKRQQTFADEHPNVTEQYLASDLPLSIAQPSVVDPLEGGRETIQPTNGALGPSLMEDPTFTNGDKQERIEPWKEELPIVVEANQKESPKVVEIDKSNVDDDSMDSMLEAIALQQGVNNCEEEEWVQLTDTCFDSSDEWSTLSSSDSEQCQEKERENEKLPNLVCENQDMDDDDTCGVLPQACVAQSGGKREEEDEKHQLRVEHPDVPLPPGKCEVSMLRCCKKAEDEEHLQERDANNRTAPLHSAADAIEVVQEDCVTWSEGAENRKREEKVSEGGIGAVDTISSKVCETDARKRNSSEMSGHLLTQRERSAVFQIPTEPDVDLWRPASPHTLETCNDSIDSEVNAINGTITVTKDSVGEATTSDQDSFVDWISKKIGSISLRERTTISSLTSGGWKDMIKKVQPNRKSPQGIHLKLQMRDEVSLLDGGGISVFHRARKTETSLIEALLVKQGGPKAMLEALLDLGIREDDSIVQSASEILSSVLRILKHNPWLVPASVRRLACDVIGMVCVQPNVEIPATVSRQCILAVIEIMESHPVDAGMQSTCCRALGSLASLSTENKSIIVGERAIQVALAAMKKFCQDADVQRRGCYMLGSIAQDHPVHGQSLSYLGGVEAVLQSMRQHPDDATVQRNACGALGNICHPQNAVRVGLISLNLVLAAMGLHMYDENVQCSACYCIRALDCGNLLNRVMPVVLDSIHRHIEAPFVQQRGIEAIASMCARPNIVVTSAMMNECVDAAVKAMKRHSAVLAVQYASINVIGALYARPQTSFPTEVSKKCLHAIFAAMKAHCEVISVRSRCADTIAAVAATHASSPDVQLLLESLLTAQREERVRQPFNALRALLSSSNHDNISLLGETYEW